VVQVESARQRLACAAEVQAQLRAEGWVTVDVEKKFEVSFAGHAVRGKIDRIDRHETTGAIRVLDYKTSDTAVAPDQAHLRSIGRTETPPAWLVAEVGGKARAWQDLQLPLYRHAVAAELGAEVACAYFNLPKAVGETGLALWENYSLALQESAMVAVEAVCAAICAGEFWPPTELTGRDAELDEFAALFHRGAAESVAWPPKSENRAPEAEGGGA
jgi:ATP-dependent helicase/nuclease subunit B